MEIESYSETQSKCENSINVSYNSNKSNTNRFLEEIALQIDHAVTENKSVMLMRDFKKNYLHALEKAKLDAILTPYGINALNNGDATKIITNNSHILIIYFIVHSFEEIISCFNGDSCFKLIIKQFF